MSPRWATVAGYGLYFYAAERHRRPHVDMRRGGEHAMVDVVTGEILAGDFPPRVLARYVVALIFADQTERVTDLEPLLWGPMFEPLVTDYNLFRQVEVDPDAGTIVWPNGAANFSRRPGSAMSSPHPRCTSPPGAFFLFAADDHCRRGRRRQQKSRGLALNVCMGGTPSRSPG